LFFSISITGKWSAEKENNRTKNIDDFYKDVFL
jgi:hypothetical protein